MILIAYVFIFLLVFIWSAINPKDYLTWFLEVMPAIIALVLLSWTYKRFKLTHLSYLLIFIHAIILMIGAHYTYAEVPWFDGLFGFERNNYDKVGHFAQGFIPAIIAREIIIRRNIIYSRFWQNFFSIALCLAFSAFYEIIEWFASALLGSGADDFLGTQGYVWDTQSDMLLALIGATVAIATLSKVHDRLLRHK